MIRYNQAKPLRTHGIVQNIEHFLFFTKRNANQNMYIHKLISTIKNALNRAIFPAKISPSFEFKTKQFSLNNLCFINTSIVVENPLLTLHLIGA